MISAIPSSIIIPKAPEELFSIHLVKFTQYIFDGILQPWYNNVFDCVNPPVCGSDNLIENSKSRLQGSKFYKCLDCFRVDFTGFDYLLTASTKTCKVEILWKIKYRSL